MVSGGLQGCWFFGLLVVIRGFSCFSCFLLILRFGGFKGPRSGLLYGSNGVCAQSEVFFRLGVSQGWCVIDSGFCSFGISSIDWVLFSSGILFGCCLGLSVYYLMVLDLFT